MIAVGKGATEGSEDLHGFVVKTKGGCTFTKDYPTLEKTGTDCKTKWDWSTKLGNWMLWSAESPDASYIIVVGNKKSGTDSVMHIAKLKATDGSTVWEMNYGSKSTAETIAFTSDGGFVVGGFIDSSTPIKE